MKSIKVLLGGLVVIAIVAVIGVVLLAGNLNQLVKDAVERVGPQVTGTPVKLNEVDIALMEGKGVLRNFTVGNPQGYTTPLAFQVGEVVLKIDPTSVTSGVVVIEQILIEGAKLTAEQKGTLQNNLKELADTVKRNSAGSGQATSKPAAEEKPAGESAIKLIVGEFLFNNGQVDLITEKWGDRTLQLPRIQLKDVGRAEGGISPDQLAAKLVKPIMDQASAAVQQHIAKLAEDAVKEKLKEREDELKGRLDEKLGEKGLSRDDLKSLFNR